MVFIFIILILTTCIFFFVIKKEPGEEKWEKQLNKTLLALRFDKSEDNNANLAKHLMIINERKTGPGQRKIYNLYSRREQNFDIYICDYLISSSSSGYITWERHLTICVVSQQLNLPRFSIEAIPQLEGWMLKLTETAFSSSPLPLLQEKKISNLQFNKRFKLYCSEEIEPGKFFEASLFNEFIQQGNVNLDAKADTLAFHNLDIEIDRLHNKFDSQKIITLVSFAKDIFIKLCRS